MKESPYIQNVIIDAKNFSDQSDDSDDDVQINDP